MLSTPTPEISPKQARALACPGGRRPSSARRGAPAWAAVALALQLAACGGGSDPAPEAAAGPGLLSAGPDTVQAVLGADVHGVPEADAAVEAQPSFHVAPVLLDPPADDDADGSGRSAALAPRVQAIPGAQAQWATRGLTVEVLEAAQRARVLATPADGGEGRATIQAAASNVTTYTPAQIRAAYGLPALPASLANLTAAQAAALGAGQTVYIVNARHNPNVAAELAAFNAKFGLPACSSRTLAPGAALPLAAPPARACELLVAYATPAGGLAAKAPAYDAGWATEIALDVQWVHATAPLARLVLVEAVDPSLSALLGAVQLANAMGPGVVSMSFGANEGGYTASVDAAFTGRDMHYLAATGDSGTQVSWPAVSPNVVGVGGTRLAWSGSGARSETAWSLSGGGVSAVTPLPAYQQAAVPGLAGIARRAVSDVAFNADPGTGQYVAVITPGQSAVKWISAGGTSLATPQWAGLVAVARALRLQGGRGALGSLHALLYTQLAIQPTAYAGAFADIVSGANGSCSGCAARSGFDLPTGLGTPQATPLLNALAGLGLPPVPPVLSAPAVSGTAGQALAFTVATSAPNPVTYALVGAPAGMVVSAAGSVSWPKPTAGSWSVTVVATDTRTGLKGQVTVAVTIASAVTGGLAISAPAVTGVAGKALAGSITVSAPGASSVSLSVAGVPAGMAFSASGLTFKWTWPSPVTGTRTLTITARDSAGRSASATQTITVSAK
ncbi:putative Ig domain-containing protein [Piscinibacter sakaiensis]|uniref:Peptidase S53 domain-containing protein n=1 Tax=Piscinibacter sakaiensis TaxID=1547922 RepID=A0A0K8P458_PISS1|nr:putative Ig domain-containing protein [Piscinibacter sakaiensis]GAP37423.1 hypothetical protein ISF6_3278 [Piscinibacter sakaiensis]